MDIKRRNELIMAVANGRRADEICKDDAERELFARMEREQERMARYGIGPSPINDIDI